MVNISRWNFSNFNNFLKWTINSPRFLLKPLMACSTSVVCSSVTWSCDTLVSWFMHCSLSLSMCLPPNYVQSEVNFTLSTRSIGAEVQPSINFHFEHFCFCHKIPKISLENTKILDLICSASPILNTFQWHLACDLCSPTSWVGCILSHEIKT